MASLDLTTGIWFSLPTLSSLNSLQANAKVHTVMNDVIYFNVNGQLGIFMMSRQTDIYPWPAGQPTKYTLPYAVQDGCMANDGR